MMQASQTLSDRISILNERDKQLRATRERQTDINTATAVTGTCPDMCPELERYFREDTKQLSEFEKTNDVPNAHAMIKEYRRAGADQSEPLAHELRPGPVLVRTMDYLVCNVLDRQDDPGMLGEWYDFLWNRTRAIRKDITQQHLCDETSVSLLEKCARFHIHCSATLCEEDASLFEPKMNQENLTKCMVSLKDFYYDLSLKGILCPNEPEFRCYDILLNLGDSDILRKLKHMRMDIRDSASVKFAVKAFVALTVSNFVGFFNLVKKTTYLNACIMHRYFDQARTQGLKLFRRAYTRVGQVEHYPVDEFCRHLGFDDSNQAKIFCEHFHVAIQENSVLLTRESLNEMSGLAPTTKTRSRILVEVKRRVAIGEIINNGPLPENPYMKFPVHDSFDPKDRLKQAASTAVDQKRKCEFLSQERGLLERPDQEEEYEEPEPEIVSHITTAAAKRHLTEENIAAIINPIAANICDSVVTSEIRKSICETHKDFTKQSLLQQLFRMVLTNGVDGFIATICHHVLDEERKNLQESMARWRLTVATVSEQISNNLVEKELRNQVELTCRAVREVALKEFINKNSEILASIIINSEVTRSSSSSGAQVYNEFCHARDKLIHAQRLRRSWRLATTCFVKWKKIYERNKRSRHIRDTFPAATMETSRIRMKHIENKRKSIATEPMDIAANFDQLEPPAKKRTNNPYNELDLPFGSRLYMQKLENLRRQPVRNLLESSKNRKSTEDLMAHLQAELRKEKVSGDQFNKSFEVLNRSFIELDNLEGSICE